MGGVLRRCQIAFVTRECHYVEWGEGGTSADFLGQRKSVRLIKSQVGPRAVEQEQGMLGSAYSELQHLEISRRTWNCLKSKIFTYEMIKS